MLFNKWGSEELCNVITGDTEVKEPGLLALKNMDQGIKLLKKHIDNKSNIVIHCDVDMDGVGAGYVVRKFLQSIGRNNIQCVINSEKEHGITDRFVDYINKVNCIGLVIVVDSTTNELERIKKLNCDLLVLDHHDILHEELVGKAENGNDYVIVNNMVGNTDIEELNKMLETAGSEKRVEGYELEERMSGCLVSYELIRLFCEIYRVNSLLEYSLLYQWVGVTLFSDVVLLGNLRNQWYIEKTVNSDDCEVTLKFLLNNLNSFSRRLDKSFIIYNLVPVINRAIRAGANSDVLNIIMNNPMGVSSLLKYREIQDNILKKALESIFDEDIGDSYIVKDISELGINKNYTGVIAGRLCGDYGKNTAIYVIDEKDGLAKGSFRGRFSNVNYRKEFADFGEEVYAQGHKEAFGFKLRKEDLKYVMGKLGDIENKGGSEKFYLTMGKFEIGEMGEYHIDNIEKFKKEGNLWRLGISNSKLSTLEEIHCIVKVEELELIERRGKLWKYKVHGLNCKAFEEIKGKYASLYVEHRGDLDFYIRNVR